MVAPFFCFCRGGGVLDRKWRMVEVEHHFRSPSRFWMLINAIFARRKWSKERY